MIRALVLALLPLAAQAQTFGLPPGCSGVLTVQAANCTVAHLYTCANDPEGFRRSIRLYSDGFDSLNLLDAEGQWIETIDTYHGTTTQLMDNPVDPGLWSDIMDDGIDPFDFTTIDLDRTAIRYVGTDKLTGGTRTIDGVDLIEIVTEIRAESGDGSVLWTAVGTAVASTEWRLFLGGVTHWDTPDDDYSTDDTPVTFHLPGEPGFLSSAPQFGCAG